MAKTYLFSARETIESLQSQMREYLDTGADYCNYLPLIEVTLEQIFYGYSMCPEGTVDSMLRHYGLAEPVVQSLSEQLKHELQLAASRCLPHGIESDKVYSIQLNRFADVEILEMGESGPPKPEHGSWTDFAKRIKEDLENGDWYPESVRRTFGF